MFNNLIESSSHTKEFKRRGSFLLFTTATYVVLFVVTGVVSIYAYDAHLEERNLEVVTLLPPQEIVPEPVPDDSVAPPKNTQGNNESNVPQRAVAMLDVDRPEVVPVGVSAVPNKNLPLPPSGPVEITGRDRGTGGPSGPGTTTGGSTIVQPSKIVITEEPPPLPEPTPLKVHRVSQLLNSVAEYLPKPPYPQMAKIARVQGRVSVQVLIDETGRVVSAKAIDGPPLLVAESQRAAYGARFSPTKMNGQAVKVSGVITYNFVLP